MGAQCSVDSSYTLREPLDCENKFWTIYPATRKEDEAAATVFIHDNEQHESNGVDKAVKYLRSLRHPGLLKCQEVFETSAELSVVTEPVIPLKDVITDLNIQELVAGIHGLTTTVAFLHNKCNLSHNNLCLQSVFVGQNDACWKLGAFECMNSFNNMTKEFVNQIKPFRDTECIPPEEEDIKVAFAHAQDAFGLGKLILDIFDQVDVTEPDVDSFKERVEAELINPDYQERVQVDSILTDNLFQNGYIEILDFLNSVTIKTSEEKATFFRGLHHKLQDLPATLIANRLLHLLLSRFVLIEPVAVEVFLPHLLTPMSDKEYIGNEELIIPLLPEELYKASCLPILTKLFEVNDRHVRMILLKYFHLYVTMFEKDFLRKVILHQLMLGLQDSDDEVVSATFSALQYLVPLLGSQVVIGGERTQQFTERRPKFGSQASQSENDKPKIQYVTNHMKKTALLNKVKSSECKTAEEKMKDRERRRQETRQRNEERRKQKKILQMEKEMAKKAALKPINVEEVHDQSDNDFESWGDLPVETDLHVEVSDGSEHGRPSSSEVSLDSGYCEKPGIQSSLSSPVSPRMLREKFPESTVANSEKKTVSLKPSSGMKLGKAKQNFKKKSSPGESGQKNVLSSMSSQVCDNQTPRVKNINSSKDLNPKTYKKTVDSPWKDFEITVAKKKSMEDDLFADMAPSISVAPKAPVKGMSMYSDKLAVDNTTSQNVDGWMDDDW